MAERQDTGKPESGGKVIRAAAVLSVTMPPLRDAAVDIRNGRIRAVVPWRLLARERRSGALELGDVILLPGLVNAHCHLDYTDMAGQLPPQESFTDWLKLIVSVKASWTLEDFARSWQAGAAMLVRSGTTTVADIEAVPSLLPRMWAATPLRVVSLLEMIGVSGRRPARAVLTEALGHLKRAGPLGFRMGLSPHSPYSTSGELLQLSAETARKRRIPLATHLAESQGEFQMFRKARGEMYQWLKHSGREMSDCGGGSPVAHLDQAGMLGPNLLAVHVNHLAPGDAHLLGGNKVNVVHCPRSHFYFKHRRFPLAQLARAGANVCLGTDSLASVYRRRKEEVELDMFAEMRALAESQPRLSAEAILRMATVNGARALGLEGRIGVLARGAWADLIALPMPPKARHLYDAVVQHAGPVLASMIGGRWVVPPQI